MRIVATSEVHAAVDRAAAQLLDAAGSDGIVSRKDIRTKLFALEGTERDLVEALYQFIDRREGKRSTRMTRKSVDAALTCVRTELVDRFDLDKNGLSDDEIARMSELGKLAVSLARTLKGAAGPKGEPLAQKLEPLTKGLFFDGCFGTEGSERLEPFYSAAKLTQLTRDTFRTALGLKDGPADEIVRFEPADRTFDAILEVNMDTPEGDQRAKTLVQLMKDGLHDIHALVVGQDDGYDTQWPHRVFIVGIDSAGNLVGVKSRVIWT